MYRQPEGNNLTPEALVTPEGQAMVAKACEAWEVSVSEAAASAMAFSEAYAAALNWMARREGIEGNEECAEDLRDVRAKFATMQRLQDEFLKAVANNNA